MRYLRTNTNTIVTVGPFYDKTDGVTIETALTITNERITFTVDLNNGAAPTLVLDNITGAASATANDLNYITNNDAGLMQLELAAANVNYVGRAFLSITDAANHCPVFHEFMILPANVYDALILGSGTDLLDVSAVQLSGTACTGRDIGASVLLSAGTGTGQLDFTSGVVKSNLAQILGTALTETAGLIAASFKKFFNIATPTGTVNSLPDAVPDAVGGLPVTGTRLTAIPTIALVTTVTTATNLTNLPAAAATSVELAKVPKSDSTVTWNATALGSINTQCDTAISDAALATAANLATVDGIVDSILDDTGTSGVIVVTNNDKSGYLLAAGGSTALTEGYAALGNAPTIAQMLYEIRSLLAEKSISTVTLTTKKLDGTTTAATYTLDDATNPTSITRAS